MNIAERFMALFNGLSRAHGEYTIQQQKGAKAVGKAVTKKAPVTPKLWEKHLEGKQGIGIIPIRDDSTVVFGAIDIDSYGGFEPSQVAILVASNNWPLVVCRSKSGGAHLYLFTSEPVPARLMRGKLKQFAIAVGYPKAEIFPKQDSMHGQDDIGNWINMPYFGGDSTNRHGYDNDTVLSSEEFLDFAEQLAITTSELESIAVSSSEFNDAPPCLEHLTASGFPPGSMNNGLFNLAVYAKMKFPEEWQRIVYQYNDRFMGPGPAQEVQQIIKSVDKKKYTYKCAEAPICGVCDKSICVDRKFSPIGDFSTYKSPTAQKVARQCILEEVETPVTCWVPPDTSDDEPYWVFKLHGYEMDVSVDMVQSQTKFIRFYLKKFHRVLLAIDEARWARRMNELLETAVIEQMAPDAGPEGQLFFYLEAFCNGKAQARVQDELIIGKPWKNEGRVFFRSQDLVKYLDVNRFKEFSERQLFAIFRRHGAKHHKFMIKGKCVACWSVPSTDIDQGELDLPDVKSESF